MATSSLAESIGESTHALVGRATQLRALSQVLQPDAAFSMAYVHGSAGIGKSALLRALAEAASRDGYTVLAIDGREVAVDTATLDAVLSPLHAMLRPLLVIDTYEDLASLGSHLRQHVLPDLPSDTRIVIASRFAPEPAWLQGVWGQSMLVLDVELLDDADADEFLVVLGVEDPVLRRALVEWAEGLPLALSLGASAAAATGGTVDVAELDGALLDHLTGEQLDGADREVLSVSALAPAVDARLLAATLPGVDGRNGEDWLRGLSFSEPLGSRVTLHSRVRSLIQAELKRHEPANERALRLRIVDHLAERSATAEPHLIGELREVVEAPEDEGVTLVEVRADYRVDVVRSGDAAAVRAASDGRAPADYVDWLIRWIEDAPEHVFLVRRGERIVAVDIWATPRRVPVWADEDPVLARGLAHAAEQTPDGNALLHLGRLVLGQPSEHPAIFLLANAALVVRSGLPNMRRWYSHVLPDDERAIARHAACDSLREPGLDSRVGDTEVWGFAINCGPGGLIGMTRDRAHALHSGVARDATIKRRPQATSEVVRRALRTFHQALALADSPLAVGNELDARAESVRGLLRAALAGSFGESVEELEQRAVIELGYLDPDAGHARAIRQLHLSRSTYYRRLREATERMSAFLSEADMI